jgi:hypothetical protein
MTNNNIWDCADMISAKWSIDDSIYVFPLNIFFDSSAMKPLGLYGNLLGLFVAYS